MQDDPEKMLADWVQIMRKERGWTQADLADRLAEAGEGMPATAVTRLEKGKRAIRFNEVVALLTVFDRSFGDLVAYFNTVYDFGGRLERTPEDPPTLLEVAETIEMITAMSNRLMQEALERHRSEQGQAS